MNARLLGALLLVLCVLLAGCGGGDGEATPETTAEPTSIWGESVSLDQVELPPGAGPESIDNVSALVSAHRSVLEETGYSVRFHRFQNGPEGYANVSYVANSSVDSERAIYRIDRRDVSGGEDRHRQIVRFHDGGTFYRKVTEGEEVTYDSSDQFSFREIHTNVGSSVRRALASTTFGDPSAHRSDGRVYVQYDVVAYEFVDRNRTITDAVGTLVIRDDGLIVDLWVQVETETGTYTVEQFYESVGDVTVTEPDWIDEAADGEGGSGNAT